MFVVIVPLRDPRMLRRVLPKRGSTTLQPQLSCSIFGQQLVGGRAKSPPRRTARSDDA